MSQKGVGLLTPSNCTSGVRNKLLGNRVTYKNLQRKGETKLKLSTAEKNHSKVSISSVSARTGVCAAITCGHGQVAPARLSHEGHPCPVTPKSPDVFLHPLHRRQTVLETDKRYEETQNTTHTRARKRCRGTAIAALCLPRVHPVQHITARYSQVFLVRGTPIKAT